MGGKCSTCTSCGKRKRKSKRRTVNYLPTLFEEIIISNDNGKAKSLINKILDKNK